MSVCNLHYDNLLNNNECNSLNIQEKQNKKVLLKKDHFSRATVISLAKLARGRRASRCLGNELRGGRTRQVLLMSCQLTQMTSAVAKLGQKQLFQRLM